MDGRNTNVELVNSSVIEVVFLDHAEGPQTLSFRVFGRLAAKTRLTFVIDCSEPEHAAEDDAGVFDFEKDDKRVVFAAEKITRLDLTNLTHLA